MPLLLSLFLSVLGVAGLLWALEWMDPSFKSERQIARYLDVPVLGSMPDLNKITNSMTPQDEPQRSEATRLA